MKKVARTSQIKAKTSNQATKSKASNVNKTERVKRQEKNPLAGMSGGTGLDDYNLDVMKLD